MVMLFPYIWSMYKALRLRTRYLVVYKFIDMSFYRLHAENCRYLWYGMDYPFKRKPQKMVADEFFECIWPFCGVYV